VVHDPMEFSYGVAFLLGLTGGVHCGAMCGGIAAAFGQLQPHQNEGRSLLSSSVTSALALNFGRISSYAVAGGLAGALGYGLAMLIGPAGATTLRVGLALMMIAVGLAIGGFAPALSKLEALGLGVWRRLSPLMRHLRPADRVWKWIAMGALWGWLPCGLVYAALAAAATNGSALRGALLMVCFGLGTLPALLASQAFFANVLHWTRLTQIRWALGALVVVFGVWTLVGALGTSHDAHHSSHGDLRGGESPVTLLDASV